MDMFRRLRYGIHLLNLRLRRRLLFIRRRLPRSFFRNLALFYGTLLVLTILVAAGRNNIHFYQSIGSFLFQGARVIVAGGEQVVVPAVAGLVGSDRDLPKSLVQRVLPIFEPGLEPVSHRYSVLRDLVKVVTTYDLTDPRSFLVAGLPRNEGAGLELPRIEIKPAPSPPVAPLPPPPLLPPEEPVRQVHQVRRDWGRSPLIAFYHTHNSETYHSPGMNPSRFDDYHLRNSTDTGIMRVGAELTKVLENKYGVPVLHSRNLHDHDGFLRSYINSLGTVTDILRKNPQLKMVFDIHRDGVPELSFTTRIGGEEVGQILIVVTTDAYGLPHTRYRENLAFAQLLHKHMEEMYPGLSRGVRVVNTARYNQHVHPRALLLEVGNYNHSEQAAIRSARLLADVLARVLEGIS
jgi:stage II sporulation protein P